MMLWERQLLLIDNSQYKSMDTSQRFVRIRAERANGFIDFDFAIGEPEIFVELILGVGDFNEFCATNKVIFLPPLDAGEIAGAQSETRSDWDWRLFDATATRFK